MTRPNPDMMTEAEQYPHAPHCRCNLCRPDLVKKPAQVVTPPIRQENVSPSTLPPERKPPNWPHGFWDMLCMTARADVDLILQKEHTYQGSWKKRGGPGAFFTFARPIDRYEQIARDGGYDLFAILQKEHDDGVYSQDGTLSATIRDIRCYLLLLEAEATVRKKADNYQRVPPEGGPIPPTTNLCEPRDAEKAKAIYDGYKNGAEIQSAPPECHVPGCTQLAGHPGPHTAFRNYGANT